MGFVGTSLNMAFGGFSQQQQRTNSSRQQPQKAAKKSSIRDRTPEEANALFREILSAIMDAGPRAGPVRTFQAVQAVRDTTRQVIIPKLQQRSGGITGGGGGGDVGTATSKIINEVLPVALRTFFEKMGATYVKLGQFIASSPTLFPAEYVTEFQKCLDQTDALPFSTIKKVIEDDLGGSLSTFFDYVDEKPLASASIAQVHKATLRTTGENVVIKVQKPGIDEQLKADLGFIFTATKVLEFIQPDWERTSISGVAGDIRTSMLDELDFIKEARNNIEFLRFVEREGLKNVATAPRVYMDYTTKRVLTMECLDGVSMLDPETIQQVTADPAMGTNAIITALNVWSLSLNRMPWFHADVHAGNLLLLRDGRVGFIDFGIVGRISDKVFKAVNDLSTSLAVSDFQGMARALCDMGATDEQVNIEQFAKDLEKVVDRMTNVQPDLTVKAYQDGTIEGTLNVDDSEITNLLLDLVDVTETNGLRLPREFGLLVKQVLYFDRYLKILAPQVDVMSDSRIMLGGEAAMQGSQSGGESLSSEEGLNGQKEQVIIDI